MADIKALVCPNCGGQLQDFKQGIACCPYCGANVKELVDNYYVTINENINIENATVVYDSEIEFKNGLKNVKDYLDVHKDYNRAGSILSNLEKYAANSSEYWWLSARNKSKDFSDLNDNALMDTHEQMLKYILLAQRNNELDPNNIDAYTVYLNSKYYEVSAKKDSALETIAAKEKDISAKKANDSKIKILNVFNILVPIIGVILALISAPIVFVLARLVTPSEIRSFVVDAIVILTMLIIFFVVFMIITIIINKIKKLAITKSKTSLNYKADAAISVINQEKRNIGQYDTMISFINDTIKNNKNIII